MAPILRIGLSIIGLGTQYPPSEDSHDAVATLANKFYDDSPSDEEFRRRRGVRSPFLLESSMRKVLAICRNSGIRTRSVIAGRHHPIVNQDNAPSIKQIHDLFITDGVALAVAAARRAMQEARIDIREITHIVSTTCTDSANPGFDHYVLKQLGVSHPVEKVLLHGVGCSGGLAVLRTAANLALGHTARRRPARILCLALEVCSSLARSELSSIDELQETRIGLCLFSDCASAMVLSNGIGRKVEPVYELLGWDHQVIPETENHLRFDVDPLGWKVMLTPQVPRIASGVVQQMFEKLTHSVFLPLEEQLTPSLFDWALHPGGLVVLDGVQRAMSISPEQLLCSREIYENHGNSSSATIFSILDRLRRKGGSGSGVDGPVRDHVVGCAFGPGMTARCACSDGLSEAA